MAYDPDMSRLVSFDAANEIPHRAYPWSGPDADGTIHWQVEYMQDKRSGYWGPRGSFEERGGKFHLDGKEFDSAYSALRHRVYHP